MSRDGSISFEWAGAERQFRLAIGELRFLQEHEFVDAGPSWVLSRLETGVWRWDDVVETICLGLIGGGKKRRKARKLVDAHMATLQDVCRNVGVAQKILTAALVGAPDESPKKQRAGGEGEALQTPLPNGKWRFAIFYSEGAVMGLGADAIDRMSVWQFLAAQGGLERQAGGSADPGLSDEEFRELSELVDQ